LNLPTRVTFNTGSRIDYTYDATGVKQSKQVTASGVSSFTYYAGNFIYEQNTTGQKLAFFSHPEGYVEKNGNVFNYIYQYKDHLGNVRLSYKNTSTTGVNLVIVEENNYYPFGLKHKGYNNQIAGRDHKYGFGNKEEQNELGLDWIDITARNYDPALGRWMNIDPLAEKMRRHSPYNYAFDNPIYFIDPDGMAPVGSQDDPIYAKNFWGNLKLIGDDGKDNGRVYYVKGATKRAVKESTSSGDNFEGSLEQSNEVASVDSKIKAEVESSFQDTNSSGRENGGHMMKGADSAVRWDEGSEPVAITTAEGKGARASISPFTKDGVDVKPDNMGDVDTYWHVHPDVSLNGVSLGGTTPSGAVGKGGDIGSQRNFEKDGFKGNTFIIGAGSKKVRFYNSKTTVITIKLDQFIKSMKQ